jgi:histidine ammonia-lyase
VANAARGHAGASRSAARLLALRGPATEPRKADPFSIRTAPVVIGALRAAVDAAAAVVEAELNAACDNPLWFADRGLLEVGHFHGAPVALAMDQLRLAVTQAVTQSERRTFRLVSNALTGDLPSFLVEGTGLNSGFMLAQYTAASLASECKGLSHPACVDTIPTMQHREDHVSMGPISGRATLRVLEAAADVVGIETLLATQALDWRVSGRAWREGHVIQVEPEELPPAIAAARARVRAVVATWTEDRELHPDIRAVGRLVRAGAGDDPNPW